MWKNRVLWSEGLFLRPQHFQQQDRAAEHATDLRLQSLQPYGWGMRALELDAGALARGVVQVNVARGVLPDGTPFSIPDVDPPPPPLEVPASMRDQRILLAVPLQRPGVAAAAFPPVPLGSLARYEAAEYDAPDGNDGFTESAPMQVARLRSRLLPSGPHDGAFATLGVCRVVERRADGRVELDPAFVPPALHAPAVPPLRAWLAELRGLVAQRTETMAQRMGQPGKGGVAEIAEFLLLMVLNRHKPVLDHLSALPVLHPERLYTASVELLGELSTFNDERRLEVTLAAYDHDDLQATFKSVIDPLRIALGRTIDPTAIAIELRDRGYGFRQALVGDRGLFASASFVLAVGAQMPPDAVRARFPNQAKVAPGEKIRHLVNSLLPGITLKPLPVAPRQIPYHAGLNYFELDNRHELWRELANSAGLAIHVTDDFPGLELELWAIRK